MTKMAGKKDLKFFISGTDRPMAFKHGVQHWGLFANVAEMDLLAHLSSG